jgi:hypothetical protein
MRNVFWYTPFSDLEGDVRFMVTGGNDHQRVNHDSIASKKKKTYINCLLRKPRLGGLAKDDRLYIIGHGDRAAGYLVSDGPGAVPPGFTDRNGTPALTPQQLFDQLEADGITWEIEDIRVYACQAARGMGSFVESFAALVHAKNKDAKVYGYMSLLDRSTAPGSKLSKFDTGGEVGPASKWRVLSRVKTPILPEEDFEEDDDPFGDADPFAKGSHVSPLWKPIGGAK